MNQAARGPRSPVPSELLSRWLIPALSRCIPRARRDDWIREWTAELWHHTHARHAADREHHTSAAESLSLARGLLADAACLGFNAFRDDKAGSAPGCLYQLILACIVCASVELLYEGSLHAFNATLADYFVGRFMLVALPSIFVALATMPRRPRLSSRGHHGVKEALPVHARWQLFLAAKIALSITLGFLMCVLVSIPARKAFGHPSDWLDILLSTLVITTSLRLALDDQKQRCHKCLRLLRQPVRVGPPSYNLLNWSGTELICSEGHGLLQVPEMQGSWCWYDLWVEADIR